MELVYSNSQEKTSSPSKTLKIIESRKKFEAERARIAASLDARLAVMEANPNSHKISLNYMRRKTQAQGMTRYRYSGNLSIQPDEMDAHNIVKLLNEKTIWRQQPFEI